MFEINTYLLNKMGWSNYSKSRYGNRIGNSIQKLSPVLPPIEFDDPLIIHFYDDVDSKVCYVIKELSTNEKQNTENLYKFIIHYYKISSSIFETSIFHLENTEDFEHSFEVNQFGSNESLFKLIIKYEACNEKYKRHFRINKLLK
jgi:hypothetical protein